MFLIIDMNGYEKQKKHESQKKVKKVLDVCLWV